MILVDTGPLVALFDPRDRQHRRAVNTLRNLRAPLSSTVAVLTEAFHMLEPQSIGSDRLRAFALQGGLAIRSEEHTSELQSQSNLVCRLLLEKKKQEAPSSLRGGRRG